MHGTYSLVRVVIFLSTAYHLAFAAVFSHRVDLARKPLRKQGAERLSLTHTFPGYVKRGIEGEEEHGPSSTDDSGFAGLRRLFGSRPEPEEHTFMMVTATTGGPDGIFDDGPEDNTLNIEMLIVDFLEPEADQKKPTQVMPKTIEAVKSVKKILPPPTLPFTLRAQQITEETRENVQRLKVLANVSAGSRRDPFARLVSSLGNINPEIIEQATTTTQAEKAQASFNNDLPIVVQSPPQSQNTFGLSDEQKVESYNTSHHSQL